MRKKGKKKEGRFDLSKGGLVDRKEKKAAGSYILLVGLNMCKH